MENLLQPKGENDVSVKQFFKQPEHESNRSERTIPCF